MATSVRPVRSKKLLRAPAILIVSPSPSVFCLCRRYPSLIAFREGYSDCAQCTSRTAPQGAVFFAQILSRCLKVASFAPMLEKMNIKTIVLATRNAHKTAELSAMLGKTIEVRNLREFSSAPETIEDAPTFAG